MSFACSLIRVLCSRRLSRLLAGGLLLSGISCSPGPDALPKATVLPLSPRLGTIRGHVTVDGQPLRGGRICFYPADGSPPYVGNVRPPDGWYEVPPVPVGRARVTVDTDFIRDWLPGGKAPLKPPWAKDLVYVPLPAHYRDPATSGLSCEVQPGTQTCDFALKSHKKGG
jgi:hypothetical protein